LQSWQAFIMSEDVFDALVLGLCDKKPGQAD
jgi:hypothetical protein